MKLKLFFFILFGSALLSVFFLFGDFFFSPGKLHSKHSKIEKCGTCHKPFAKPRGETCTATGCHDSTSWKKLKGVSTGHLETEGCLKCHTEHKGTNGKITLLNPHKNIDWESNCLECHRVTSSHLTLKNQDCKNCHLLDKWKPAAFNHNLLKNSDTCITCHSLPKKHIETTTACIRCHTITKWKPAKIDHKLLSKSENCLSCHKLPVKHFETDQGCAICHYTTKWKPANFKHTFPMNHENKRNWKCIDCHPTSLDKYDCYAGCHEHTERNVRGEHLEEGIRNYTDCIKCHPTGREHEQRGGGKYGKENSDDDDD